MNRVYPLRTPRMSVAVKIGIYSSLAIAVLLLPDPFLPPYLALAHGYHPFLMGVFQECVDWPWGTCTILFYLLLMSAPVAYVVKARPKRAVAIYAISALMVNGLSMDLLTAIIFFPLALVPFSYMMILHLCIEHKQR